MRVLLVEDNPGDARLVAEYLGDSLAPQMLARCEVTRVGSIGAALDALGGAAFDVTLLDLILPDSQGLDTVRRFHAAAPTMPVVVMSALGDEQVALEALQEGAQDYLVKGHVDPHALTRAMRYAIERQRLEERLRHSNRALQVLSECNEILVRATDEGGLLRDICRTLVDVGGYRFAWVGIPANNRRVAPVAHAGHEAGYLETVRVSWDDSEHGRGPTGTAIRTGQLQVVPDIASAPEYAPWRTEALQRGYRSSIALPLGAWGQAVGVLNVYAADPGAFEPEAVQHLSALAGDLAFGVAALRAQVEAQHMQENLRESEARYRTLTEIAPVGIFQTDAGGHCLYVSERWCEMTGLTPEEALGDGWTAALHPDDQARVISEWNRAVHADHPFWAEYRFQRRDGAVTWVLGQLIKREDESGQALGYIGAVTNITERKRAEEEARRLNAELERRVRERTAELQAANTELEAFTTSVSHDLHAPLRRIVGFSGELLDDSGSALSPAARDRLQRVRTAAERMNQLVDDLLQLAHVTRAEMQREPVDLSALAQSIVADLQRGNPGRSVELLIAPGVVAYGDTRLLRVALENLLANAWKFTRTHRHARIEFGVTEEGERVYFVRDDGIGVEMNDTGELFGGFQRLHSTGEFEGTGVGLTIVQRIIHRHGGRVWAESAVEQGATFYFTLGPGS